MINISNNSNLNLLKTSSEKVVKKEDENKVSFSEILKNTIEEANELKVEADKLTNDYLAGRTDNLHEVMIASQKAEISILFVTEVRNRLMDAYQEFARMQV